MTAELVVQGHTAEARWLKFQQLAFFTNGNSFQYPRVKLKLKTSWGDEFSQLREFVWVGFSLLYVQTYQTHILSRNCPVGPPLQLPWHLFRPLGTPKLGMFNTGSCHYETFYGTEELSKSSHSQLHLEDPQTQPPASVYPEGRLRLEQVAQELGSPSPSEQSRQVGESS